jgi:hypothetical protein
VSELSAARDGIGRMLEGLGLSTYRYEVEPREGGLWSLVVECRAPDGWRRVELELPAGALAPGDEPARRDTLARLAEALPDCARQT